MELSKIEKLLERYDEGKTSLAEEKLLRDYFLENKVPPHLRPYQLLYLYSQREKQNGSSVSPRLGSKNFSFVWSSVAAILIVAMGLFFLNNPGEDPGTEDLGTITDKDQALQRTKETLDMVSQLMNEGKADLVYLKEFNNTKNKIIQLD